MCARQSASPAADMPPALRRPPGMRPPCSAKPAGGLGSDTFAITAGTAAARPRRGPSKAAQFICRAQGEIWAARQRAQRAWLAKPM
eukprot:CAMPEP_0183418180 /NCGR_PEP_ID=MMETSP0370-20130417/24931_1 /TAXON_ID=268820 /ORGANISM="Peridinium aciculiferum, Strain PAER-2" /LENGTH=85 /DNA_ID=CAMNT_0025601853 /DNA_START=300 /DNA_END=554 /DNA_ORIENTATION=-